jgi:hypothetical protein
MSDPTYDGAARAVDDILDGAGDDSTADFMPTGILPGGMEPGTGVIPDDAEIFIPQQDPRDFEIGGNNDESQKEIWDAMERGDFGAQAGAGTDSAEEKVGDGQT